MDLSFTGGGTPFHKHPDMLRLPTLRSQFNAAPPSLQATDQSQTSLPSHGHFLEEIVTFRKKDNKNEYPDDELLQSDIKRPHLHNLGPTIETHLREQQAKSELFQQSEELRRKELVLSDKGVKGGVKDVDQHPRLSAFSNDQSGYLRVLLASNYPRKIKEMKERPNKSISSGNLYEKIQRKYINKRILQRRALIKRQQQFGELEEKNKIKQSGNSSQGRGFSYQKGTVELQQNIDQNQNYNQKYEKSDIIATRKNSRLTNSNYFNNTVSKRVGRWRSESQHILREQSAGLAVENILKLFKEKVDESQPLRDIPNFKNNNSCKNINTKIRRVAKRLKSMATQYDQHQQIQMRLIKGINIQKLDQSSHQLQGKYVQVSYLGEQDNILPKMNRDSHNVLWSKNKGVDKTTKSKLMNFKNIKTQLQQMQYPSLCITETLKIKPNLTPKVSKIKQCTAKQSHSNIKAEKCPEQVIKIKQENGKLARTTIINSIKLYSESRKTRSILQLLGQQRCRFKSDCLVPNCTNSVLLPAE